jgi:hypothetical protein
VFEASARPLTHESLEVGTQGEEGGRDPPCEARTRRDIARQAPSIVLFDDPRGKPLAADERERAIRQEHELLVWEYVVLDHLSPDQDGVLPLLRMPQGR